MDNLVRERSLSQILDSAFDLLRSNFYVLFTISFISEGLFAWASDLALFLIDRDQGSFAIAWLIIMWLPYSVLGMLAAVAISHALDDHFRGHEPGVRSALLRSLTQLGPILITGFTLGVLSLIGFFLLVIPAFIVALIFFVIGPVIAMEKAPGMSALSRSRQLMRGHKKKALAILLFWFIPYILLEPGLQLIFGENSLPVIFGRTASLSVATAYSSAATFLLYIDIRSRKEAYDLQYLADRVSAQT